MKKKSFIKGLILGASVLAFAGTASADVTLNIYGASAQFNYWHNMAISFLSASMAAGGLGCTAPASNVVTCSTAGTTLQYGGKAEVAYCTACAALAGANCYIHYTAKASFDGPQALDNSWGQGTNHQGDNWCATVAEGGLGNGLGAYQRLFCQTNNTLACDTVYIGACDVDVSDFRQTSSGLPYGPWSVGGNPTSTTPITRAFSGFTALVPNMNPPVTPIAVPFAFYVNPGVTVRSCKATSPRAVANAVLGLPSPFCSDDQQCGGATCTGGANNGQTCWDNDECTSGACTTAAADVGDCPAAVAATGATNATRNSTITNLSRLQVTALFSGSISNWQQFGLMYPNLPVTVCLRHAGSGTHATLDLGVMHASWGANILGIGDENRADNDAGSYPYVYFNDGSGDMKNCLYWADDALNDQAGHNLGFYDATAVSGAVGYIDADTPETAHYLQVAYNGVTPNRVNIRDGLYDDFWSLQRVYTASSGSGLPGVLGTGPESQTTVYNLMIAFMANGSNITQFGNKEGVVGVPAIANWYTSSAELNFTKPAGNTFYPGYSGASGFDADDNSLPYAP